MEIIKQFEFNDNKLTTLSVNGNVYFKGKDVAKMLGYENTRQAIIVNCDEEDRKHFASLGCLRDSPVQIDPQTVFINESGMYSLIFGSKKKQAKKFKHWVTSVVLPSIRKTGHYEMEYKVPRPMLTFRIENENDLHKKVVNFVRQYHTDKKLLFNSTNGELQDTNVKRIDAYNKGYSAGMPDFIMFNPTATYNGLIIEFKTPKCDGELSEKQEDVINHFKELNYRVIVSNDYDKIIIALSKYIDAIRIPCKLCSKRFKNKYSLRSHMLYFHRVERNA